MCTYPLLLSKMWGKGKHAPIFLQDWVFCTESHYLPFVKG